MIKPYRDYADFLAGHFEGKVQKISVSLNLSCPNRDGTRGRGGCSYCNNSSFSPAYTLQGGGDVRRQLEQGKRFFTRKYPEMRYLAYFQSYTSTNSPDRDALLHAYREAMDVDGVVGVVISTRPDCVDLPLLKRLKEELPWVMMEYGAESSHDTTLAAVNRNHTWADVERAVTLTAQCGIPVGIHLIMGLPGETREMMLATINRVNNLPIDTVKIHQLQLIRGTRLADEVASGKIAVQHSTLDEYVKFCAEIVRRLRPDIAIERFISQSPPELLISPRWGVKNYQFADLLRKELT